ncbi:hypothetical protein [Vibrio crassostreae]|uniref:hypothetical protein n=1 Tax=Vibrio crassostreae TaxID=246167 RepID=UPI001B30A392|nr:hypothetical protein [Vibrio crassostreae]
MRLTSPDNQNNIPSRAEVQHQINESMHGLSVEDEPLPIFGEVKLGLKPLEQLIRSANDHSLVMLTYDVKRVLGSDLMFGATKFATKRERLKAYDEGIDRLRELNHPYVVIKENGYTFLEQSQFEALKNDAPTCNICKSLMAKRNGRYGEFFTCEKRCEGQKNVSASYWDKIKRQDQTLEAKQCG